MKIIDPGHIYELHTLDPEEPSIANLLRFVKREGESYPGNVGHHEGTTSQDVLRALIDRTKYVHNQIPHPSNVRAITSLREAIWYFESRAAERHGRKFAYSFNQIEKIYFCSKCGHIGHIECGEHDDLRP